VKVARTGWHRLSWGCGHPQKRQESQIGEVDKLRMPSKIVGHSEVINHVEQA